MNNFVLRSFQNSILIEFTKNAIYALEFPIVMPDRLLRDVFHLIILFSEVYLLPF